MPLDLAALDPPVTALLRYVADDFVMPRFGRLAAADVLEKTPGELVTIADRESEERLTEGLAAIFSAARVIGEEGCAADPALVDRIGEGLVWIVDPIDGTANFAVGRGPFGIMVALIDDGVPLASWILDPLAGRLCHARRGDGAWIDGASFRVTPSSRARPIAGLATQFMSADQRATVEARGTAAYDLTPIPRCAAEQYPRVALGVNDVALFQRTLAWDHAAGALFLLEAGGAVTRWDGAAYRIGDGKAGLIAATDARLWADAHRLFFEQGPPPPPFAG
ncbi:inositol monophosphatase family protein [Sphingomonas sp.]|uniref:inositol monophosphatase family protein n=1 Tax=Sphingomonas sp. TaxID=28214 RepID=UPI003CC6CC22